MYAFQNTSMLNSGLRAFFIPYNLHFKKPGGTSRGILYDRHLWLLVIYQENVPDVKGIGECAPLKGLSIDDRVDFEIKLREVCNDISNTQFWLDEGLTEFPSIKFGLETALLDLSNQGKRILFPSPFTQGKEGIHTNGLIWMNDFEKMLLQVEEKLSAGFRCIKMKIGAIDFEKEMELLRFIRKSFPEKEVGIRVDANGAFSPEEALQKLERLSKFKLHSIEQPIRQGQKEAMKMLCKKSPVPIALDEELIGIFSKEEKRNLLAEIQPQYIILKPTLVGGFQESREWIQCAEELKTGWWITSALESNIGLNAIAQWTYSLNSKLPQGLGTGQLFTNNFESPLKMNGEYLFFDSEKKWMLPKEIEH